MELIQTFAVAQKSKLTSLVQTTLAGIMLKSYMAMSHLWLLAEKMKKADSAKA